MRAISTPTWTRRVPFRLSGRSPTWSRAIAGSLRSPSRRRTSCRGTIRSCSSATRPHLEIWRESRSGWTDPRHRVLPPPELGQQLAAQTGAGRRLEEPADRSRHMRDELVVPTGVEGAHGFLNERVRRVNGEVHRGRIDHRTGAVVRRDRQLPRVSERGDAPRFADATAPGEVEHHDSRYTGLEQILETPSSGEDLRGADRRLRVGRVLLEKREAVHADRVLVPEGVELRKRLRDALRGEQAPEGMKLHHDVHPVADHCANLSERLERSLQIGRRDVLTLARFGVGIEGPNLHPGDAALEKRLRQLVGTVKEGVEILERALGFAIQAPVPGALAARGADIA